MTRHQRDGGEGHDRDLHDLQAAGETSLVGRIRERSSEPGKEDERSNECRPSDRGQRGWVETGSSIDVIGHHQGHRLLEQVVVEAAERLRPEQRREAAGTKKLEGNTGHSTLLVGQARK